jgi:hypothetical protein
MSRYSEKPLNFDALKTVPIDARGGKVRVEDFARPYRKGEGVKALLESLPRILAADSFRGVIAAIRKARDQKRALLWGMGGHVVKCGLGDVLIDLMNRGWITGFVMNGAASIHDFEIAIAGQTSEDVEAVLPDGRFGAAEETGREMNLAIVEGTRDGIGMGEALGRRLTTLAKPEFAPHSVRILRTRIPRLTALPSARPRIAISACCAPWCATSIAAACISMSDRRWCCRRFFSKRFPW